MKRLPAPRRKKLKRSMRETYRKRKRVAKKRKSRREKAIEQRGIRYKELPEDIQRIVLKLRDERGAKTVGLLATAAGTSLKFIQMAKRREARDIGILGIFGMVVGGTLFLSGEKKMRKIHKELEQAVMQSTDPRIESLKFRYPLFLVDIHGNLIFTTKEKLLKILGRPRGRTQIGGLRRRVKPTIEFKTIKRRGYIEKKAIPRQVRVREALPGTKLVEATKRYYKKRKERRAKRKEKKKMERRYFDEYELREDLGIKRTKPRAGGYSEERIREALGMKETELEPRQGYTGKIIKRELRKKAIKEEERKIKEKAAEKKKGKKETEEKTKEE